MRLQQLKNRNFLKSVILLLLLLAEARLEVTPDPEVPPSTPSEPIVPDMIQIPRKTFSKAFYAEINEVTSVRDQLESQSKYVWEAWDMNLDCRSSYWYLKKGGMYDGYTSCH